jgi:hypothetical protein
MVSGNPTTFCGNDNQVRKCLTVGFAPAGHALIIDRTRSGSRTLVEDVFQGCGGFELAEIHTAEAREVGSLGFLTAILLEFAPLARASSSVDPTMNIMPCRKRMSPSRRPRSRAIARTLPICWVIVSSDIADRNISSAWVLAKSSPAGDPARLGQHRCALRRGFHEVEAVHAVPHTCASDGVHLGRVRRRSPLPGRQRWRRHPRNPPTACRSRRRIPWPTSSARRATGSPVGRDCERPAHLLR